MWIQNKQFLLEFKPLFEDGWLVVDLENYVSIPLFKSFNELTNLFLILGYLLVNSPLGRSLRRRNEVIREIVATEKTYLEKLNSIVNVFNTIFICSF